MKNIIVVVMVAAIMTLGCSQIIGQSVIRYKKTKKEKNLGAWHSQDNSKGNGKRKSFVLFKSSHKGHNLKANTTKKRHMGKARLKLKFREWLNRKFKSTD